MERASDDLASSGLTCLTAFTFETSGFLIAIQLQMAIGT